MHIRWFEDLLLVRSSPTKYLFEPGYLSLVNFFLGYDHALGGAVLAGFDEWLALRLGRGSNQAWPILVLYLVFPAVPSPLELFGGGKSDSRVNEVAIQGLFALLEEFHRVVPSRAELLKLLASHEDWRNGKRRRR